MKPRFLLASLLVALLPLAVSAASSPAMVMPGSTKWAAGTGDLKGMQVAVLYGDPAKAGPFALRVKIPSGTKLPSHYHSSVEHVTVISGLFMVGIGDKWSSASMTAMPAGAFAVMPASVHHYAATKGVTVIQIDGQGPFDMKMVGGAAKM